MNAYNSDPEPEAVRDKSSVSKCREIRVVQSNGKRVGEQDLPFGGHMRGQAHRVRLRHDGTQNKEQLSVYPPEEGKLLLNLVGVSSPRSPFPKVRHLDRGPHSLRRAKKVPACYKGSYSSFLSQEELEALLSRSMLDSSTPDLKSHPNSQAPFLYFVLCATTEYKMCILFSVNTAGSHPDSPSDGVCPPPPASIYPLWT